MDMLSVTIPAFSAPSGYQLSTVPRPELFEPFEVLIEVHAASINPNDIAVAEKFPYHIGCDCAGAVTQIGAAVKRLKVGDEVFVRLPEAYCAPLAFKRYKGCLEGKVVFVPAGLSGTGSYACQLAKNVFKAGKVITTVSTAKVPRIPELLGEGVLNQIIDYTKNSPNSVIPPRSVDFCLDTTGEAMSFLSLMVPNTRLIMSISTTPSGTQLQEADLMKRPGRLPVPWYARGVLNAMDAVRKARAWRWGVQYSYFFLETNGDDLEALKGYAEEGKVKPAVGSRVGLRELEKVKKAFEQVYAGKGGIGKAVISMK